MTLDAQGHVLSGASPSAAETFDLAVRALTLSYGDAVGLFETARKQAPGLAMAHLGKAWAFGLANDAILAPVARGLLAEAQKRELGEREQAHAAALSHGIEGHRRSAVRILDRHLMSYPRDLLAHYAAMLLDAFQGHFDRVRDRAARALPFWSRTMPGYGILLSFYAFGLEEAGHYGHSEATGREAAELEPYSYWPHHAVSHVLEMTGRPAEGLQWMDGRLQYWSGRDNTSQVHIWWHKALFHLDLGETTEALSIYDGPLLATQRPVGLSLTNGTALLWRLETLGCASGERWQTLADLWQGHADGRLSVFADIHAGMTACRAGRTAEFDRIRAAMQRTAASGSESAPSYREAGLPVVDGLVAFARGDYRGAVENLLPARPELWRMGGSKAQRDIVEWTLTEAALRAGLADVARSLANERVALKPDSNINRRFRTGAEALRH